VAFGIALARVSALPAYQGTPPSPRIVEVGGGAMRVLVSNTPRVAGSPAVILEAGAGASGIDSWQGIFNDLARVAPSVAYDRRGLGESQADTQPQTYARIAQSLHDLLAAIDVGPPYILVGHSAGGVYIRGFSTLYPDEVVGYVYVETPDFEVTRREKADAVPPTERADMTAPVVLPPIPSDMPAGGRAEIDFLRREIVNEWPEARKLRQKPDVPVAVIIAAPTGRLKHPGDVLMQLQIRHQSQWALESSNGLVIVSGDTGHRVQDDAPELVIAGLRHVLSNGRR
jgi:pimeloyl-ACP methyl ester carboxylesterase